MQPSVAREEAVKLWTTHPCGAIDGDLDSLAYFLDVERSRYLQQPWQRERFGFEKYSGKRVLEIGVGLGTDLAQFGKAGAECHGIDITDRHLALTARNFEARGLKATLTKCDATRTPYPDAHFDVVYSFGVIHHIPDAPAVVREIQRVLKPGGKCLVALYRRYSFFHMYLVLVRGILMGRLFRLGYEGLLATIEGGADGVELKPYVKLYNRREAAALFTGFDVVAVSVHQVELGRFSTSLPGRLLRPLLQALEPVLGWYVVCEAVRRA